VEEETDGGEDADRWGPHVSERKGKKEGAVSVSSGGPWATSLIWAEGFPEVQFHFYFVYFFSFSVFLISFITFA
jgi:hypothetical protein